MPETWEPVVLAAGLSRRMGTPKLALPLHGRPVLARTVDMVVERVGVPPLVVVPPTGPVAELARAEGWRTVVNPDPERGLASSLRAAVHRTTADAVLIFLGDEPEVPAIAVHAVTEAARANPDRVAVVPWYRNGTVPGHPVLLRRAAFARLAGLSGDRGARAVLSADETVAVPLPVPPPEDLDTPTDYARWQQRHGGNTDTGNTRD